MIDSELIKQLLLGTGPMGVLAYLMFLRLAQHSKESQERLLGVLTETRSDRSELITVVKENSRTQAELRTLIADVVDHQPRLGQK